MQGEVGVRIFALFLAPIDAHSVLCPQPKDPPIVGGFFVDYHLEFCYD